MAFIGGYRNVVPSEASEQALVDFAAWRLDIDHVDPRSGVTLESLGSSRWEEGVSVTMLAMAGHRDASLTVCSGDGIQYRLGGWAEQIALTGGPKIYGDWHQIDLVPGSQVDGYTPTAFPFHFSEQMSWALAIVDGKGTEVFRQTGVGIEGSVTWAGTLDDMPLPGGDYTMHLEAVPSSGAPTPQPATFDFTLGSFKPPSADDEGSIHENDIGLIATLGITSGCGPELFCPGQRLARWQMALFLTRLHEVAGFALPTDVDQGFTDIVGLPPEYQSAINQLALLGITRGTGPESFDPQGLVSREQMALFLIRWSELAGVVLPDGSDQGFADISHTPAEHQIDINRLAQLGITTGTAPGSFTPDGAVTREQMASFLARIIAIVPSIEIPIETASASNSTTDTGGLMKSTASKTIALTLITLIATLVPATDSQAQADPVYEFYGSGWGHGVGMSQYGARAMARSGMTAEQIINTYYSGVTLKPIDQVLGASHWLRSEPAPLWIGITQNRTALKFHVTGGSAGLCKPNNGEGECPTQTANIGEVWEFRALGGGACQFFLNDVAVGNPETCQGEIAWTNQPQTRIHLEGHGEYGRGTLKMRQAGDGFHVVLQIGIDEYIYGLGEMPSFWHTEGAQGASNCGSHIRCAPGPEVWTPSHFLIHTQGAVLVPPLRHYGRSGLCGMAEGGRTGRCSVEGCGRRNHRPHRHTSPGAAVDRDHCVLQLVVRWSHRQQRRRFRTQHAAPLSTRHR